MEIRTIEKIKGRVLKSDVTQASSSKINLYQENVHFFTYFLETTY